jgi:hypothetical protein
MAGPKYGDPDNPAPNADPHSTDDLHNTQSPYADGGPMTDSRPSDYPLGAVPGYYSPGPLGNNRNDQGNPWVAGSGDPSGDLDAQRYMQDSLDAVTAANFDNLRSGTGSSRRASQPCAMSNSSSRE